MLSRWGEAWRTWMGAIFLKSYMEAVGQAEFVPRNVQEKRILLKAYLLDKCLVEIDYEMQYRPDWLRIPIRGILDLIGEPQPAMQPSDDKVKPPAEIQAQRLS